MSPFIFKIPIQGFLEKIKIIASDGAATDLFGFSVAIEGSVAVVGAYISDPSGIDAAGSAYVYEFDGNTWNEVQKLTASDKASGDQFGWSVGISGTTIVIGANKADVSALVDAGAAYVFEKSGTWPATETAKITASDKVGADLFGQSVSISGNVIVVGANQSDPSGISAAGAAYVYEKSGTWPATETAKITASDKATSDQFGWSVSIESSSIVVGARYQSANNSGAAYIFEKSGTWPATETAKITASDGVGSDNFGWSVDINGNIIVVSANGADPGGLSAAGAAYIFEKSGTWPATETAKITASDKIAGDRFGQSVSVSGTTVIAGAYAADPDGINAAGAAYVFDKGITWPATETAKITVSDKAAGDSFGYSVSISGNDMIIGARLADPGGVSGAGAAYIFKK